ncbi:putative polygalacturonase [Sesamum angolense]|uniref:Polygalacturonase n=1 Tax=Sesamum angolense TaxID=2727404 RepID=A0AAE1WI32_9LAMI|nr:putative polygalacturonase [Sesamum angolense]
MMEGENPLANAIRATFTRPSWGFLLLIFTGLAVLSIHITRNTIFQLGPISSQAGLERPRGPPSCSGLFEAPPPRKVVKSISEFGGVGDGRTSNTAAFRRAMEYMEKFRGTGGTQLNVPKGRWLTGSFNLTSDFTLFLEDGAVILGSQVIMATIDGQGKMWWDLWWNKTLEYTRGHLVELINSHNILITNLTFRNSPFWTIHPVYSSNVVIKNMTILAPLHAPNTDGIDPDSSTDVCIEDCYIESGDDLVAVKSGWDHYGIRMARPSVNITVRRVSGTTPTCSGIGIGSEMSGGIRNVLVENLYVRDSAAGVRIKTDKGRGGYITNITMRNIMMERVKVPIRFSRGADDHPDEQWDSKALPKVKGISISNVISVDSRKAPLLQGIDGAPFEDICMKNVSISGLSPSVKWNCEFVSGFSDGVSPVPCFELQKMAHHLGVHIPELQWSLKFRPYSMVVKYMEKSIQFLCRHR